MSFLWNLGTKKISIGEVHVKILQVTHLFYPDQLAGASLYTDLALFFKERGHDVRVTTTFPYYPALKFAANDRGVLLREDIVRGIPVRRVGMWLPQPHRGWRRLAPEVALLGSLTLAGAPLNWTPDVVFVACPMLSQAAWQNLRTFAPGVPRLLVVQDSMAHSATELGIIKNRGLGWALHTFERWSFRAFELHSTISLGMRKRVREIGGGRVPCVVTPNWIHGSLASLVDRRCEARENPERTVRGGLFYSGNFGVKQGLPSFLSMMDRAKDDWSMTVHGGGAETQALLDAAVSRKGWLKIGGLLDEIDYVDKLLGAGACVVTQMPGVGANFLPSKLLPALATGTPVLGVCEMSSPLGQELQSGGFGAIVEPGDVAGLREVLMRWRLDPSELARLSQNATRHARRYTRERLCGRYEKILSLMAVGAVGSVI